MGWDRKEVEFPKGPRGGVPWTPRWLKTSLQKAMEQEAVTSNKEQEAEVEGGWDRKEALTWSRPGAQRSITFQKALKIMHTRKKGMGSDRREVGLGRLWP